MFIVKMFAKHSQNITVDFTHMPRPILVTTTEQNLLDVSRYKDRHSGLWHNMCTYNYMDQWICEGEFQEKIPAADIIIGLLHTILQFCSYIRTILSIT